MTSKMLLKSGGGKKRWDRCIHSQGDYFEGEGCQNWASYASIFWPSPWTFHYTS
jgi:hypothetical protein